MPTVTVTAKRPEGFRRAGEKWTKEPRTVDVDAKVLALLKAEPQLTVVEEQPKKKEK